jgi:hypothetical protein
VYGIDVDGKEQRKDRTVTKKIELKLDYREDGEEYSVADFPVTLVNGKTVEITDEQIKAYEEKTGNKFADVVEGIAGAKVTGGGK